MASADPLPADVLDALRRGNTIEAIKLLRTATGLGLTEAKYLIDQHLHGGASAVAEVAFDGKLPPAVLAALRGGNKIEAIKLLREHTGLGLKEAKDAVEAQPQTGVQASQLSPGEVRASGGYFWWGLIALAIAGFAVYYFLGAK